MKFLLKAIGVIVAILLLLKVWGAFDAAQDSSMPPPVRAPRLPSPPAPVDPLAEGIPYYLGETTAENRLVEVRQGPDGTYDGLTYRRVEHNGEFIWQVYRVTCGVGGVTPLYEVRSEGKTANEAWWESRTWSGSDLRPIRRPRGEFSGEAVTVICSNLDMLR